MRLYKLFAIIALIVIGAALLGTVAISAQDIKPAPKKEEVFIGGEGTHWEMKTIPDATVYTITGNVVIKHLDTVLTSKKVTYTESKDKKTRVAVADGDLKIVDSQNIITGTKATADLNARNTVIDGNVKLISKGKATTDEVNDTQSAKAQLKSPATITCDRMEYQYRKKIATADGNLKITQKGRVLVGNKGVYDVKQELVTLTGGVKVTDEQGQTFTSPGVVKASLKDGAEWIESENGSANIKVTLDDEPDDSSKPTEKPAEKK